ncbi:MAG TPA: Na-translocating system protein MpsC family protein [Solirubrobacteraceae bacterium]|nr:Na-translocating system protein MpsC family protein [Solirubrobacteraceae bacterium]
MTTSDDGLARGPLNAAIANEIGKLIADFTGRGATKSRAFVHDDVVVCLLENGATKAEINLVAAGRDELVRLQRDALQRAMETQLVAAIERVTGRTVRTFLSGTSTLGESSVEVFVLEPAASQSEGAAAD